MEYLVNDHHSFQSQFRSTLEKLSTDQFLVVVDPLIWEKYQNLFSFPQNSIQLLWKTSTPVKTFAAYEAAATFFLSQNIHRRAHLVAIGGGSVSDFGGFLAATLLRGLQWSVVPTTLLSMVDAAIGGKVGLDTPLGKNLIGAFHLPQNLFLNPQFLETLPKDDFESGLGEILKYALLDLEVAELVRLQAPLNKIIDRCVAYKMALVKKDPHERGDRIFLNLGHSLGHAFELLLGIPHGVAVAQGILWENRIFNQGRLETEIQDLAQKLGLNLGELPILNAQRVLSYLEKDKKRSSYNLLALPLVTHIGSPFVQSYPMNELGKLLEEHL